MNTIQCQSCLMVLPQGSRYCGQCGSAIKQAIIPTVQGSKTLRGPFPVLEDIAPSIFEPKTPIPDVRTPIPDVHVQGNQGWSEADLSIIESDDEYTYGFSSPSIETILEIEKIPTVPLHSERESEKK